jgi:ribosomal protein S7
MLRLVITLEETVENGNPTVVVKAGTDGITKTATPAEVATWRKIRKAMSEVMRHTAHREYLKEREK